MTEMKSWRGSASSAVREAFEDSWIGCPMSGCWLWTKGKGPYGFFYYIKDGITINTPAHRFAYELYREPIPKGLVIDHLCFTTRCVNPAHLEPVTRAENSRRGSGPHLRRHPDAKRVLLGAMPQNIVFLLTKEEAAACLQCSLEELHALRLAKKGPRYFKIGTGRYKREEVERWMEQRE